MYSLIFLKDVTRSEIYFNLILTFIAVIIVLFAEYVYDRLFLQQRTPLKKSLSQLQKKKYST